MNLRERSILGQFLSAKMGLMALVFALPFPLFSQITFSSSGALNSITGSSYEDCAVDVDGDGLCDVVRVTSGAMYIDYQQPDWNLSLLSSRESALV